MNDDLSTADVATMCAVSTDEVRNWINTKSLQATKGPDKKWRITQASFSAFLARPGEYLRIFLRRREEQAKISVLVFAPTNHNITGLDDLKSSDRFTVVQHEQIPPSFTSMTQTSLMFMLFDWRESIIEVHHPGEFS